MENKKFLLIFPPLWTFTSPHLALPCLSSQLKNNGFPTKVLDLNIIFFNYILTEEYLNKCIETAKEQYMHLAKIKDTFLNDNSSYTNKILNFKYKELSKVYDNINNFHIIAKYIPFAVNVFKNQKLFYNYKILLKAQDFLEKALYICSLPYIPSYINFRFSHKNHNMKLNLNDIKNVIFDKSQNMFLDFYETQLEDIINQSYSYIGISISSESQLIGGLTLANLLKNKTNAHINIGGGFFSRTIDGIKKNPEFFDIFAHSISYDEGENSIIELAKYINNEISVEEVHNYIYKKNNEVVVNPTGKPVILSRINNPDFDDYNFKKYFSPDTILPLQTSRGCYWNKCTFCDHSYGKTYTVKKINDLIKEIKENIKKYNIFYYDIIDEAIHPEFLNNFSNALIENNLHINFKICARFEEQYNYKILKNAYNAGLRYILWGFETGNKRIHTLINKGVNFNKRINILKTANEIGIANLVFSMYNFPTETIKEANDTLNFFIKYHDFIQVPKMSKFSLLPSSAIIKDPKHFGIILSDKTEDFSIIRDYKTEEQIDTVQKNKIEQKFQDIIIKYYSGKIFIHLPSSEQEHLLLYNTKYSLAVLKQIKLN